MISRRRFFTVGAATLGAAALAGSINEFYPINSLAADQSSATGQRRRLSLPDGSDIFMNARTRINIEFSSRYRRMYLLAGALAAHPSPQSGRSFEILTQQGRVRAGRDTSYMVRQTAGRTVVAVHKGDVMVQALSGGRRRIPAGTGALFDAFIIDEPRPELLDESAWCRGLILVNARPLAEVVAALRPYRAGVLRVNIAAGSLPVTGRFCLVDTQDTLRRLAHLLPITVASISPWFVTIDLRRT